MKSENPSFDEKLYKKHYGYTEGNNVSFTKEELSFIENNKTLKIYFDPNWEPLEKLNSKTNKPEGAVIDILNIVAIFFFHVSLIPAQDIIDTLYFEFTTICYHP